MTIKTDTMRATDGTNIFYRSLLPEGAPKAAAVISHGYAEHGGRYENLMKGLAAAGIASVTPDHRGHGKSAKVLGFIDSFDALVDDLALSRAAASELAPGKPVFMVSHSMGSMATLLYLSRHGADVPGAVVIGPAIEVPDDIPSFMISISKVLSKLTPKLGVQPFFDVTQLSARLDIQQSVLADPLFYRGKIRARTGAQLYDAMVATNQEIASIEVPMLLLHGGQDSIVKPRTSETVLAAIKSSDKTREVFENARHEILNEPCEEAVIARIAEWLEAHI